MRIKFIKFKVCSISNFHYLGKDLEKENDKNATRLDNEGESSIQKKEKKKGTYMIPIKKMT